MILDFEDDLHNQYPSNSHYNEFVKIVSEKIKTRNDGWEFYHHLDDNKIGKKNKWHPIHIRKPMLDIFSGTTSIEEQADIFYETANKLIKIVTDEDCFWVLRNDYKLNL